MAAAKTRVAWVPSLRAHPTAVPENTVLLSPSRTRPQGPVSLTDQPPHPHSGAQPPVQNCRNTRHSTDNAIFARGSPGPRGRPPSSSPAGLPRPLSRNMLLTLRGAPAGSPCPCTAFQMPQSGFRDPHRLAPLPCFLV